MKAGHDKAAAALGGKKKSGGKGSYRPHEMHIKRAKGGHVVTEHMSDEDGNPPENPADAVQTSVVPTGGLADHIAQSGIDSPDEDAAEGQQQQQPVAGAQ